VGSRLHGDGLDSDLKIPGKFYDPDPNITGFIDLDEHDYHLADNPTEIGSREDLSAIFTDDLTGQIEVFNP